jgi:hypothetical protein
MAMVSVAPWVLLVACETPPSAYIPPTEPREVPNLDPPPGIPIMPSGSAARLKAPDGGGDGATAGIVLPTCRSDRDCVVTAQTGCCDFGDPRAELRVEFEKMKASCKEAGECDGGNAEKPSNYSARCVKKSCTLVPKRKKSR